MSKTAQRKRSHYQEGYRNGWRGARCWVNPRWQFAGVWRAGWYAGRRARERSLVPPFPVPVGGPFDDPRDWSEYKPRPVEASVTGLQPGTGYWFSAGGGRAAVFHDDGHVVWGGR